MTSQAAVRAAGPVGAKLWTANFRLFFTARTVSLLGDAMLVVALPIAVLQSGYGPSGIGYALGAWTGAVAAFTVFGGTLSDRLPTERVMIYADLVRVVVQVTMAAVLFADALTLSEVIVLQAVGGIASAMFLPGSTSLIPRVTTEVRRANACLRISDALASIVGPAVAGVLIAVSSAASVLTLDAFSFLVSACCLALLRLVPAAAQKAGTLLDDIRHGWHEFAGCSWMWSVILVWMFFGLLVFGPALPLGAVLIVKDHDSAAYGVVAAAFGAGAAIGGGLGLRVAPRRPLVAGSLSMLLFALYPAVVTVRLPIAAIAVGYLLAGTGITFWGVMWSTSVQTHLPLAVLNRVSAYDIASSLVVLSLGRALAGPAGSLVGERRLMMVSTVVGVVGCFALLVIPAVRRVSSV